MSLETEESGQLTILHLSDFQFGAYNRFATDFDPEQFANVFARNLRQNCLRHPKEQIDLVIVSGDIAESGLKAEFDQAKRFFTGLASELESDASQFVFVPGNHDVSWKRCKRFSEDYEDGSIAVASEDEFEAKLHQEKLRDYRAFLQGLAQAPEELGLGATLYEFPHLSISIAALNSCELETHEQNSHRGHVSTDQLQPILDHWRDSPSRLKLIVVHHNPISAAAAQRLDWEKWIESLPEPKVTREVLKRYKSDIDGFDSEGYLQRFAQESGAQLVFFGHQHVGEIKTSDCGKPRICYFSAGSVTLQEGKLPGQAVNSFNLVRINRNSGALTAHMISYSPEATTPGLLVDGAFHPGTEVFEEDITVPEAFRIADGGPSGPLQLGPFVNHFRKHLQPKYERLDPRNTYVPAVTDEQTGQPRNPDLDKIYVPLRFAEDHDRSKTDRGEMMDAESILALEEPLAITGFPGSGKTTWVRYTFRQFLDPALKALAIPVILRDLLLYWSKSDDHTVQAYLEHWVVKEMGEQFRGVLTEWIEAQLAGGPMLVLLIDGWDELGDAGKDFREQLDAWRTDLPDDRFRLVVTSRPYGTDRPGEYDGYTTLDVQPWNDDEIRTLSLNFYQHAFGAERATAEEQVDSLVGSLKHNEAALDLARTPLTLTMILQLSRSRPLPDRRIDLYNASVEFLLSARSDQGVDASSEHRRPDEKAERLRLAAILAGNLQTKRYQKGARKEVKGTMDDFVNALPDNVKGMQIKGEKHCFIRWLAEAAGILRSYQDETYEFAHLSLQEYLAAVWLDQTHDGHSERLETWKALSEDRNWWEALRLWAAMLDQSEDKTGARVLDKLLDEHGDTPRAIALNGLVFADGLGSKEAFEQWHRRFLPAVHDAWDRDWERVAQAWAACRGEERRQQLVVALQERIAPAAWLPAIRLMEVCEKLGGRATGFDRPSTRVLLGGIGLSADQDVDAVVIAFARTVNGRDPLWLPGELPLCELWPSHRRLVGHRLQAARLGNVSEDGCQHILREELHRKPLLDWEIDASLVLGRDLGRDVGRDLLRDWVRDLVRDLSRDLRRVVR
ncbi:MAG: metallophosphoesterase, partial [Verrucomicrobiota bacterium]